MRIDRIVSRRRGARHFCFGWIVCASLLGVLAAGGRAAADQLGPSDLLLLVNGDSPVSVSISYMYRRFYPVPADQVLVLSGLADSASPYSTPADEIITRDQYESLIAQPVRDYLISIGKVDSIYCIVTTAGMPYRIEDTVGQNVVGIPGTAETPDGTDAAYVASNRGIVDAASVESELALLFQTDPALPAGNGLCGAPIQNRIVNPYNGYASSIKAWAAERDIVGRRESLRWYYANLWGVSKQPRIEGMFDSCGCSARDRIMSPADMYLVARLDGPHQAGTYPIFAVFDMLNRSAAASNPNPLYTKFVGYNAANSVLAVDSSPSAPTEWSYSPAYNFPAGTGYLTYEANPVPPGREAYAACPGACPRGTSNHYDNLCYWQTGVLAPAGETLFQPMDVLLGGWMLWDDTDSVLSRANPAFTPDAGIVGLCTYGRNAGGGSPASADYLLTGGPDGGVLFPCVPGAVLTSIESFNAATMFVDVPTSQAKIAEFIQMGGTAAVGHAFEPYCDAIEHVEYLYGNLLRDDDGDGVADLALVEAVYSSLPYLSWSAVFIGDPLMRLRSGPGGIVNLNRTCPADLNCDGVVNAMDRMRIAYSWSTMMGQPKYDPGADVDRNGVVTSYDNMIVSYMYGKYCP